MQVVSVYGVHLCVHPLTCGLFLSMHPMQRWARPSRKATKSLCGMRQALVRPLFSLKACGNSPRWINLSTMSSDVFAALAISRTRNTSGRDRSGLLVIRRVNDRFAV